MTLCKLARFLRESWSVIVRTGSWVRFVCLIDPCPCLQNRKACDLPFIVSAPLDSETGKSGQMQSLFVYIMCMEQSNDSLLHPVMGAVLTRCCGDCTQTHDPIAGQGSWLNMSWLCWAGWLAGWLVIHSWTRWLVKHVLVVLGWLAGDPMAGQGG